MNNDWEKTEDVLLKGGIAVVPTDTLYGIIGNALNKKTVERIYELKSRNEKKPLIVLVAGYEDIKKCGVQISKEVKKNLDAIWPGKVSVILICKSTKFEYLHRGSQSIAFRMIGPRNGHLYKLIKKIGPLVAPSANPEGLKPARNRKEARAYFGKNVDAYVCYGTRESQPSTLISLMDNKIKILRQGEAKIKL
jgi:L-threonylcarbamoyladenylate synthase